MINENRCPAPVEVAAELGMSHDIVFRHITALRGATGLSLPIPITRILEEMDARVRADKVPKEEEEDESRPWSPVGVDKLFVETKPKRPQTPLDLLKDEKEDKLWLKPRF